MMLHGRGRLGRGEVFARTLEEFEHRGRLPGRRVGNVDDDIRARQRRSEAFTGHGVHTGFRRSCHGVVALLLEPRDELGSDQSGPADHDDLHGMSPRYFASVGWSKPTGTHALTSMNAMRSDYYPS